ncbi:MAG: head-tail adaptor protein [Caedimonas sp.]|nr:head-tail adaptor protein [Caedimonas sp.]
MTFLFNELRHYVTLQERMLVKDERGGFHERWENLSKLWIKLTPLASAQGSASSVELRGQRRGGVEELSRVYKVVARANHAIKRGMRLHWKGLFLVVLEEPTQKDGYQFFNVSTTLKSDGDPHE